MACQTALIESASQAAALLRDGKVVAFPTETVFGLGADATDDQAVGRLFAAKGRPSDNPLILHVSDVESCSIAASVVTPIATALLEEFSPGPLTVVLPKRPEVSSLATANLDTVGVRVPDHPVARELLRLADRPIAAPSANRSGRPSGASWRSVLEDLDGRIDAVLQHDGPSLGLESTVVDCTGPVARILRPGTVTLEQIRGVLPDAQESVALASDVGNRSPGVAHPHYRPRAVVRLVDSIDSAEVVACESAAYCGLGPQPESANAFGVSAAYENVDEYAASFYEFLREADRRNLKTVYVQRVPDSGVGHALLDRQRRAAGEC